MWPDLPRPVRWRNSPSSNPVVCGRKFCTMCGRWRVLADFGPKDDRNPPINSRCGACIRIASRERRKTEKVAGHSIDGRYSADGPYRERSSRAEAVDAGPFLAWLDRRQEEPGSDALYELGKRAGTSGRTFRRARDTGRISIPIVDRVLIAAGGDTMLWELYPET